MTFINSTKRVQWTAPFKQIFWDLDGTLSGYSNGWVSPYYAFNNHAGPCSRRGVEYDMGIVCDGTVVMRRLQVDDVEPWQLDFRVRGLR